MAPELGPIDPRECPGSGRGIRVQALLAGDRRPVSGGGWLTAAVDHARRGAVVRRDGRTGLRRAEPGPHGPLVLSVRLTATTLVCEVWGAPSTPSDVAERALQVTHAWIGVDDDPGVLDEVVGGHSLLRRALARTGDVRLGRLPRVGEALGRAVIHQLVQSAEARRSVAQMVERYGDGAPGGLRTWPTARRIATVPAWELRRCGISLRGARALHAAALSDRRLDEAASLGMDPLDRRLRALPGVGAWTSAETRLALGDPDAVSVGDHHLHEWVTWTLAGVDPIESSDALMLDLLAPFAGQRGRVVTLIGRAFARGVLPPPPRRAPHAPLSAHRYW